jgi:hypothetical protein
MKWRGVGMGPMCELLLVVQARLGIGNVRLIDRSHFVVAALVSPSGPQPHLTACFFILLIRDIQVFAH